MNVIEHHILDHITAASTPPNRNTIDRHLRLTHPTASISSVTVALCMLQLEDHISPVTIDRHNPYAAFGYIPTPALDLTQ
jgi:hypothetical protein